MLVTLPEVGVPADTGKRLRCGAMLRSLSRIAELDVVFLWGNRQPDVVPVPEDVPVRSWTVVPHSRATWPEASAAVARGMPWQIASRNWAGARAEITRREPRLYDLVWFGSIDHFAVLGHLVGDVPSIVDYDDVEPSKLRAYLSLDTGDLRRRLKARVEARLWRRLEGLAARSTRAVVVCSDLDVGRLGGRLAVAIPNTYPDPALPASAGPSEPPEFLMIANFHYGPNVDAARFLATEVLPILRRAVPDAVVHIAGQRARDVLAPLADVPGLRLSSPVPDVRPLLERATAVVAPIRYGGGTRLKIIEAFAHQLPVVSTTLGAEGLDVSDGVDILLADDGGGFASACARLALEPDLCALLARTGRQLYETDYRPEVADRAVTALVTSVLATAGSRR